MSKVVYAQRWLESERNWGTRPDGYSLHPSPDLAKQFIQAYWDKMPDTAPDEYSRPTGTIFPVEVSDDLAERIESTENKAIRHYGEEPSDI